MKKCKCPPIKLFDKFDIRNNKEGKYLANQQIWDPIVSAENDCFLKITCNPIPGVSSFFTTLFRSNGSPIYINRVVGNHSTHVDQPRSISDMTCEEDSVGTYQWMFHGSPIHDFSLACLSDEDSCKCPEIIIDEWDTMVSVTNRYPSVPNQCQFFTASCPEKDEIPFIFSANSPIYSGSGPPNSQFEDLFCLKEDDGAFNWYFSNMKLGDSSLIFCVTNQFVYNEQQKSLCGVFKTINDVDEFEWYHKTGDYTNALFGENKWTPSNYFDITCASGYKAVVFSENNNPIVLNKDKPTVVCTYNPLHNNVKIWIVNGIHVINPAGSCVKLDEIPDTDMNGCKCPPIKHIGVHEIIEMDSHSSYFARRMTFKSRITVTPTCAVTLDPTTMERDDFHFMIFRYEAPPIYMRRFIKSADRAKNVSLTNLVCRKVGDKYQWEYGKSKITDQALYVAFQSNDAACVCNDFQIFDDSVTMTKLDGTCDILHFQCADPNLGVEIFFEPPYAPPAAKVEQLAIKGWVSNLTVVGAVCVHNTWYINGVNTIYPQASCKSYIDDLDYLTYTKSCPCNKPSKFTSPSQKEHSSFWDHFGFHYPGSRAFTERISTVGQPLYITNECRTTFTCTGDDTFVVFSMNNQPMIFPSGKTPDMRCVSPPVAQSRKTENYWWIDNVMTIMPVFGCFPRISEIDDPQINMNGCKCPQLAYIDQQGIRNLGQYSLYLADRQTYKPNVTVTKSCEILVDESHLSLSDHNIMLFRKNAPPVDMRRFLNGTQAAPIQLNDLKCNQFQGKYQWEYSNSKISDDVIFITIQNHSYSCDCEKINVNENSVELVGRCDYIQAKCVNPSYHVSFWALDDLLGDEFGVLPFTNNVTLACVTCLNKKWYLNNLRFKTPKLSCYPNVPIANPNHKFVEICRCQLVLIITPAEWKVLMSHRDSYAYDRTGAFRNRTITNVVKEEYSVEYCTYNYMCSHPDEMVVFSFEYEPLVITSSQNSLMQCAPSPVAQSQITDKYWWAEGIMMKRIMVACFQKEDEEKIIEMNGCECPQLIHINQDEISKQPESSYLNNRRTFQPKVTVSSSCEVVIDASSMTINNFYLMLFREEAPPVFMHRFNKENDKKVSIPLTDLTCRKVNDKYQWRYKESKLTDDVLYIALQSNEESCGCEEFEVDSNKVIMSKLDGACDILHFHCTNQFEGPQLFYTPDGETTSQQLIQGYSQFLAVTAATCVNSLWMFNGIPTTSPRATCINPYDPSPDYEPFASNCPCTKINILQNPEETLRGDIHYFSNECRVEYTCRGYNQDLVIFSLNRNPMIYSSGESPNIKCYKSPPSIYINSDHYWWIDNIMVTMPIFACYPRRSSGCKCPRISAALDGRLGKLEETKYLSDKQTFTPKFTVSDTCKVTVDISESTVNNFHLLFVRATKAPIFFRRFTAAHDKNVPVEMEELNCVQDGEKYVWHHGEVKIDDQFEATLLSSEDCGCNDLIKSEYYEINKVEGSCDAYHVKTEGEVDFMVATLYHHNEYVNLVNWWPRDFIIAELFCVNKEWYYNGYRINNLQIFGDNYANSAFISDKCLCINMINIYFEERESFPDWDLEIKDSLRIEPGSKYFNKTGHEGQSNYDGIKCTTNLICPNGLSVAVFSINNKPIDFPPNHIPDMRCAKQPATNALSGNSDMQWWLEGVLILGPRFSCYEP